MSRGAPHEAGGSPVTRFFSSPCYGVRQGDIIPGSEANLRFQSVERPTQVNKQMLSVRCRGPMSGRGMFESGSPHKKKRKKETSSC